MNRILPFRFLSILAVVCFYNLLQAQNLVPNYSFEEYTVCPISQAGICDGLAPPWQCAITGSSDLFNSCSNASPYDVPVNERGHEEARTGNGYAGMLCKYEVPEYREYLIAPLIEPLDTGAWYSISFYVSLGENNNYCAIEHIGAFLSPTDPTDLQDPIVPQVESDMGFLLSTEGWTLIYGCYHAIGGEMYVMIGNFGSDADTPLDPNCNNDQSYYYIEDVTIVETEPPEEIILDVETPVISCFSYTIDPNHPGPFFIWNTGDQTPTLTVTTTGIYMVTVTDGCSEGFAEIDVTILGNFEPPDLGADSITICSGESYEISLDPSLSEYTWQDGSNQSDYTITGPGIYAVTLDDGCSVSADQVEVVVLPLPEPFNLGDDFFLCTLDETTFEFDPSLGNFEWQDGSSSSSYTVDQPGTYSLVISNSCGEESDEILITGLTLPDVHIGPDTATICPGENIQIEIDPELGDIMWNDGWDQPEYEIQNLPDRRLHR